MSDQQRQTADTFDAYKDTYTDTVDNAVAFVGLKTNFFVSVKADHIVRLARETFLRADQLDVLDIGCGIGNYHPLLNGTFKSISGVDISSASIETAKQRNPGIDYQDYDGSRLPYPDGSFDLAYTICVIHHVPPANWSGFVSEMRRVLKPGGLGLVFEHNPLNPLTMRAVNNCPFDEDAVLLKKGKAEELLRGAGFVGIQSEYILAVPPRGALLAGLDRLMKGVPLGAQYVTRGRA